MNIAGEEQVRAGDNYGLVIEETVYELIVAEGCEVERRSS